MKISQRTSELESGHDFHRQNYAKNIGRVTVLFVCTSSNDVHICTKFHENISKSSMFIKRTRFLQ